MWLLNTSTLKLEEFEGSEVPPYAILSHTWDQEEVTFADIQENSEVAQHKAGFSKIRNSCRLALEHESKLNYVWIDTCCIDKRSSADLSEAINSMYRYYTRSVICFVYLSDYLSNTVEDHYLNACRWFTRGWTLQELIAPYKADFYNRDWLLLGSKRSFVSADYSFLAKLSKAAGVPETTLAQPSSISRFSIAQRMSWASKRTTKRPEDRAYSLMGLFHVHMTVLYGEGLRNAFLRLQLEIMSRSDDQSLFAWKGELAQTGLLAHSPSWFANSSDIRGYRGLSKKPYRLTNMGISISLQLEDTTSVHTYAALDCYDGNDKRVYIFLQRFSTEYSLSYTRCASADQQYEFSGQFADWDISAQAEDGHGEDCETDIYVVEQALFI